MKKAIFKSETLKDLFLSMAIAMNPEPATRNSERS